MEKKCCGNCKHFQNESASGNGWCNENDWISNIEKVCKCHEDIDNGWTEITPDNVNELYDKPVAVAWRYEGKTYYRLIGDCMVSPSKMAELGGYYYYVLPELKIE